MTDAKELATAIAQAVRDVIDSMPKQRMAYTLDEAAELLGVTKRVVQGAIERGELRVTRVGKAHLVAHAELQRFLGVR